MESEILNEDTKKKILENNYEYITKDSLEKCSIEDFLNDTYKRKYGESSSTKEILHIFDDKDELDEKLDEKFGTEEKETYGKSETKNFNFETLNRDLADIEERLRATRLSWNKTSKLPPDNQDESNPQKDIVRKSWSLLEIDKRHYSLNGTGGSLSELDSGKQVIGDKVMNESPVFSESFLKWDYGADIGLTQDDSDDLDPITWPVTAEQAQRELASRSNRMKISLSQGSFLASPDPEDRQNIIATISAEYQHVRHKSKSNVNIDMGETEPNESKEILSLANGIYDDLSARHIMEQAEAAEKRLRERLEAVKALHLNECRGNQNEDDKQHPCSINNHHSESANDGKLPANTHSYQLPKHEELQLNLSNDDFISETVKNQQNKLIKDIISDGQKVDYPEDDCKSPQSVTNTGRTTTMESTHDSSNYGKAPVFTGETYGSRQDNYSVEHNYVMYSKQKKETYNDIMRSFDNRDVRNCRPSCGIAPELDTISSRETLQITDEKKDDELHKSAIENSDKYKELNRKEDNIEVTSDKDISQEHSLQAKWNQFKTMMKSDEYNNLFEKTAVRSAVQYHSTSNAKNNDQCNTHRQQSTATTFTTITNLSPRYDSFATDAFRNTGKDLHNIECNPINRRSGIEDQPKNKPNDNKVSAEKIYKSSNNQNRSSNQCLNSRTRSGKRLIGGGGGKDNEDNDDEISQTERRKLRHAAELARFKKRFGSGQLDGETTASELEHDDLAKMKRNIMEKDICKKQLSQLLTDISKEGVGEDSAPDVTDISQSSSVDTMLLMNKMSHLLRKKKSGNMAKRKCHKISTSKPNKKLHIDSKQLDGNRMSTSKIIESDDAKLILKHLMLKQKVKWLADCAREEARRRKIRKLEKLMDLYEQGNPIIIPDDLETETATLMGSERGSQDDLSSLLDSCSYYDENMSDAAVPESNTMTRENFDSNMMQAKRLKSPSFRKQYNNTKENYMPQKEDVFKHKKNYPPSQAWNIPLRNSVCQGKGDFNDSNQYYYDQPSQIGNSNVGYRTASCNETEKKSKRTNLTAKERIQLRRELELARQRNAHECQKDIRHSKTGNTMVANGGLAWVIGLDGNQVHNDEQMDNREGNRKLSSQRNCTDQNHQEISFKKSELQFSFENRMEEFISRSRERQKRIKLAVDERRYESQMNLERARLFANGGKFGLPKRRQPITQPDPLSAERTNRSSPKVISRSYVTRASSIHGKDYSNSENLYRPRRRRLSKSEMITQSAKKYQCLPEVQAKYLDERRKARIQNNRMKMHLYGERILQSLLRNRGPWVSTRN